MCVFTVVVLSTSNGEEIKLLNCLMSPILYSFSLTYILRVAYSSVRRTGNTACMHMHGAVGRNIIMAYRVKAAGAGVRSKTEY
jgi:hypothetical protein